MSGKQTLRMLVDGRVLQGEDARRGMGNYTRGLVGALLGLAQTHEMPFHVELGLAVETGRSRPDLGGAEPHDLAEIPADRSACGLMRRPADALALAEAARKSRAHVLLVACPLHGPFNWIAPRGPATVAILYDLIPFLQREAYLDLWPLAARRRYLRRMNALRRISGVLAISQAVAHDAQTLLGLGPARHAVVTPGVPAAALARQDVQAADARTVMTFVSANPSKNIPAFLEAFARLIARAGDNTRLVAVGPDSPELREHIEGLLGQAAERMEYLAAPGDPELFERMARATLVVAPSTAEGFGLPVLEAMATGTAVAAADIAVLRQVAGDAAAYFDPRDIDSMADCMAGLLGDAARRAELEKRGSERAKLFCWQRSARAAAHAMARWAGIVSREGEGLDQNG